MNRYLSTIWSTYNEFASSWQYFANLRDWEVEVFSAKAFSTKRNIACMASTFYFIISLMWLHSTYNLKLITKALRFNFILILWRQNVRSNKNEHFCERRRSTHTHAIMLLWMLRRTGNHLIERKHLEISGECGCVCVIARQTYFLQSTQYLCHLTVYLWRVAYDGMQIGTSNCWSVFIVGPTRHILLQHFCSTSMLLSRQ